jgi:3-oxoacyl-[acyl-carrier-protein] synthase I
MPEVFVVSDNIYSPLGATTADNFSQLRKRVSGVRRHADPAMSAEPFYAALFDKEHFVRSEFLRPGEGDGAERYPAGKFNADRYTPFERVLIASIGGALQGSGVGARDGKTIFILSSTKGNIGLLETEGDSPASSERIALHSSARLISEYFECAHIPIVVSNACISGIVAILTGLRLIRSGRYAHAVIAGADLISKFILSGFQAFQAVSPEPCRPFDRERDGINLGEGAATMILSSDRKHDRGIRVLGGSVSNDANHLSAPSRTGEELCYAITRSLQEAGLSPADIDFISAHGTATVYNDEMEAKALDLAGLSAVPVNSLKGYYGHTLGAAGLIESIVSMQSLREGLVLPTPGFEHIGVTRPLTVCTEPLAGSWKTCLKTASGFGGCNAALLMGR